MTRDTNGRSGSGLPAMELSLIEKQHVARLALVSLRSVYRFGDDERRPKMHASVRLRIERALRRVKARRAKT